ncbi:MAG: glycine/sarcosine/betaine reductase selenoprotein B family protein [bacterium]|nr:glycine/sarcosine/betaine reductase selenoprotein B family protein [bacterium]MDE0353939.1 glycine/sarcosine/betaine reductase selenoprotein B family protein [bacterium]
MTETDRRPIDYIAVTRETYAQLGYQPYRWALNEDPPSWATLGKPLSEARLGLIASGGIYRHGQVAFTHRDDVTHREIPTDVDSAELRVTHFAFDPAAARRDPNVVFPIDTLRSLVAEGTVGELAPLALTFMGGIYSQRRLAAELIPVLVDRTLEMGADAVLLVPV